MSIQYKQSLSAIIQNIEVFVTAFRGSFELYSIET